MLQVVREPQFERLADLVGCPEWKTDPRFADRSGWVPHLDDVIRPAVEAWLASRTKLGATAELTAAGIVAGPSNSAADVIADPHVAARHMLVEMPRTDGVAEPVLIPGNPVKLSRMWPRDPRPGFRGSASTPPRCWRPSSACPTTSWPASATAASSPD